jgi:hypothetical protein
MGSPEGFVSHVPIQQGENTMTCKRIVVLVVAVLCSAASAFAQSSGNTNFSYSGDSTACVDAAGALNGGGVSVLKTALKVSSGNGVAIVVRPSAVTGLLTDVTVKGSQGGGTQTQSAQASVTATVKVTPLSGQPDPKVTPSVPITYDDRFLQISTNLFNVLSACTVDVPCFFTINETTLAAHSFDFVVQNLQSGAYGIEVDFATSGAVTAGGTALECVGPVVITATQVKMFQQSTGITF